VDELDIDQFLNDIELGDDEQEFKDDQMKNQDENNVDKNHIQHEINKLKIKLKTHGT